MDNASKPAVSTMTNLYIRVSPALFLINIGYFGSYHWVKYGMMAVFKGIKNVRNQCITRKAR